MGRVGRQKEKCGQIVRARPSGSRKMVGRHGGSTKVRRTIHR